MTSKRIERLLGDVADVRLGMAFKSAIHDMGDAGQFLLVQTKDISIEGIIDTQSLARVVPREGQPDRHILSDDDIVLRLRGPVFSAAVIESGGATPVITTNQLAVIRCDTGVLLPHYLHWYLNSEYGQRYFGGVGEGSNINKVNAKQVSTMPICLPSLEEQDQIAQIHKNWLQQRVLYQRLTSIGDTMYSQVCSDIQEGGSNG